MPAHADPNAASRTSLSLYAPDRSDLESLSRRDRCSISEEVRRLIRMRKWFDQMTASDTPIGVRQPDGTWERVRFVGDI